MTYDDHGSLNRSGGSRSGSSRRRQRPQIPSQGTYHGPRGTRQRGSGLKGPARGATGGYPVKARSINFQSGRARRLNDSRRLLILAALALVLLILIIVGISSCVSSCSSEQQAASTNPVDARVAEGVPEDLTNKFAAELNRGEKLAQIAANAGEYTDQGLLELALDEPDAIDFVAAYPTAEKEALPYEGEVSEGTIPQLWCWDSRWGNVDYAGRALALTGSGPTSLSMAYMGLTGKTDRTPADIATLVTEAEQATGDSGMAGAFLESSLADLGISCSTYTSNADNLSQVLETGTCILVEASAGSLTDTAHWVVVTTENEDGSVVVYDPTSTDVSSHSWDPATIAGSTGTLYALSAADADTTTDVTTE